MRVLVELRPALDGHSGIPQETRLVFRGLASLEGVEVEGLIQSGNLNLAPGLPLRNGQPPPRSVADDDRLDRLSRVVVSMQQHQDHGRVGNLARRFDLYAGALRWALHAAFRRPVPMTGFDPAGFEDFVWRSMFARSLPPEDRPAMVSRPFRLVEQPWSIAHAVGVATSRVGAALFPRLQTDGVDVLLAETPFPGRTLPGTRLVVRYHDAIPVLLPHTVKNMVHHQAAHMTALRRNVRDGAWFACVSDATRRDLIAVLPSAAPRAVTIPNMVSHHFRPESEGPQRVPEIVASRRHRDGPLGAPQALVSPCSGRYLLMVSTIEPRKNHAALIEAWGRLRATGQHGLHLVLVGSLGWDFGAIVRQLAPALEGGMVHLLEGVPADDLRLLYRHAALTVCPSFAEGFDFPGLEAMRSGGVVAASDIPVHRDIFEDGAAYFDPYSPQDIANVLAALLSDEGAGRLAAMRTRGTEVAARYCPERIMPLWLEFLAHVMTQH